MVAASAASIHNTREAPPSEGIHEFVLTLIVPVAFTLPQPPVNGIV